MRQPSEPALPSSAETPFSLFDGDWVNRGFGMVGLPSRHAVHIAVRCLTVIVVTWVPMAVLALVWGLYSTEIDATNFFADYAAYAQFLVAMPLFVVAERVVSRTTREAASHFLETGVVRPADLPRVEAAHRETARLRHAAAGEWTCVAVAYAFAFATILPEFFHSSMVTWHIGPWYGTRRALTGPGGWALFVALPVLNYTWIRLAWKILIWTLYLYRMSRLHLRLIASHPDGTGGIGFISEVQAKFAVVIFAYGISNVAAVIAYKIAIEGASPTMMPVWGPALGFVIIAPALFTLPLLMFTKQLFRTKRRALTLCRIRVGQQAAAFESRWLPEQPAGSSSVDTTDLVTVNQTALLFGRLESMRVVPFDVRSAIELFASTVGSIATALPLLKIEGPLKSWLELLDTLLRHSTG